MEWGNKKLINGWIVFDWANSVYPLVINSTLFPIYFSAVAVHSGTDKLIYFGKEWENTFLLTLVLSVAYLFIAFLNPLLAGLSDYCRNKLSFMKAFSWIGVIGCFTMFFFTKENIGLGFLGSFLACVGYNGSIVFYNAFLPEIAAPEDQDKISARGFAAGYIGGALFLIASLIAMANPFGASFLPHSGEEKLDFLRWCFIGIGIWWALFARITFYRLKSDEPTRKPEKGWVKAGLDELRIVFKETKSFPGLRTYMLAYLIFGLAVQTMMLIAAYFAISEIDFPEESKDTYIIMTVLIIQFVGVAGSLIFSKISSKRGNVRALIFGIVIYTIVCVWSYFVHGMYAFFVIAGLVGLGMGGIQSLARSTFSKLLPETEDHASYFSFFDFIEKISIVLGLVIYGGLEQLTGSPRISVLSLSFLFAIAVIILLQIRNHSKLLPYKDNEEV